MTAVLQVSRGTDGDMPPPYESDVSVKGWRFEIDHERLDKSDTWMLASRKSPEVCAWLLMMWLTAWKQKPAGSMPNDDELIAAHVGFSTEFFAANRKILMRGWWLANDGRLYHPVLIEQVVAMVNTKHSERDRKARWREQQRIAMIEADKNQGDASNVPRDGRGHDATGTGTGTGIKRPEPSALLTGPENDLLGAVPIVLADDDGMPACPHQQILDAYRRILPSAPPIAKWTPKRQAALRARWREDREYQSIEWWEKFFRRISKSKFLTGRTNPRPGQAPFVADIDFMLRPGSFMGIIEGKYS